MEPEKRKELQKEQTPEETVLSGPETMRETCLHAISDLAAAETWLEDRAREGWQFTGTRRWKAEFQKAEPCVCRYRLQPMGRKKETPSPERLDVYESLGWQYVTVLDGLFHVWRCEDPDAPELDTDPVVQAEGYRYLKRRIIRSLAGEAVLLVVLVALYVWWWGAASHTPLLAALESLPGRLLLGQIWLILVLVLDVREALGMRRLLRTLTAGVPLSRPRSYRCQQWLQRIAVALAFLLLVIYPFLDSRYGYADEFHGWDAREPDGTFKPGVVYWDLTRTETLAEELWFWDAQTKFHELAARMDYARVYGALADHRTTAATTTYYHMRTEGLAEALCGELLEDFGTSWNWEPVETVPAEALDAFWWTAWTQAHTQEVGRDQLRLQYAVVRQGPRVLAVEYQGTADLREQEAYLVELLTK